MADPFLSATNSIRRGVRMLDALRSQAELALSMLDTAASPETDPKAIPFLQASARNALRNVLEAHRAEMEAGEGC